MSSIAHERIVEYIKTAMTVLDLSKEWQQVESDLVN